jgi:hypothetical protein
MKAKLLQRLQDPSRSGVYRTPGDAEILDALRGGTPRTSRIDLAGVETKKVLLSRIADALRFPGSFGANWDALEDSLKDLSWLAGAGHVLVFGGSEDLPAADRDTLLQVLGAVAAFWREQGEPFFAVFVDPAARLTLPQLFRPR